MIRREIDRVGNIYSGYSDWNGKPIERTPDEYPYSYDAYVITKAKNDYQDTFYSDILLQWDYKKHNELCKKHFGDESQYWSNRSTEKIEAFLQDYSNNPTLKLVGIMTGCNVSNGYPYWIFMYDN
jgi:hypothetical protein